MSSAAPNPTWARRLATILAATTILMSVAALILLIANTAALPADQRDAIRGSNAISLFGL